MKNKLGFLFILFISIFYLNSVHFTAWPEMFSFPYFYSQNFKLYSDIVFVYPPLSIIFLNYVYSIFGINIFSIKLAAYFFIILTIALTYLIIKLNTKKIYLAVVLSLLFVLLIPLTEGNTIWPDTILPTFLVSSFLTLSIIKKINIKLLLTGVFLGLALATKQTAIFFIVTILFYIIFRFKIKRTATFLLGLFLPQMVVLIYLLINNSFQDFINWNLVFPAKYWGNYPSYYRLYLTKTELLYMILFFTPIVFGVLNKIYSKQNIFFLLYLISGFLAIFPRFSLLHFQVILPFLIINYALIIYSLKKSRYLVIFNIIVLLFIFFKKNTYYVINNDVRFFNSNEIKRSEIIKKYANNKFIFLIGDHSGQYFFSKNFPVKPWLDNFGWYYEIPGIQEKVINEFKKNPPEYVFRKIKDVGEWFEIGVYEPPSIIKWIKENYKLIDVQDGLEIWTKK